MWSKKLMPFVTFLLVFQGLRKARCQNENQTAAQTEDRSSSSQRSLGDRDPLKLSIDNQLENQVKFAGEMLTLDCEITGFPIPAYRWYKDGRNLFDDSTRIRIRDTYWGNSLKINDLVVNDTGIYTCSGTNNLGTRNTSAHVKVKPLSMTRGPVTSATTRPVANVALPPESKGDESTVTKPFCQEYRGSYCNFLKRNDIYVTSRSDQLQAEQFVINTVQLFTDAAVPATSQCFKKTIEALCYYRMPLCEANPSSSAQTARSKRLCREECEALNSLCTADLSGDASLWELFPDCSMLDNNPQCVRIGLVNRNFEAVITKSNPDEQTQDLLLEIILPAVIGLVVVVAVVLTIVCWCRRKVSHSQSMATSSNGKSVELSIVSDKSSTVFMKDIPSENVNLLQELGAGFFGAVYQGQVFGIYGANTASTVFIKTLKDKPTAQERTEFQEEISSMTELRHQAIISLLAVSMKGTPQCLIYEHLPHSDLHQFLSTQASHSTPLAHKEVMYIVTQIASAMECLASKNFIHRHVAARNVMVGQNLNVKLSNLNMTYGVHSADFYCLHNRLLPIRWLPAETITYNKFTLETDVYSLGVLLWEAFSCAAVPYGGFSNQEVIDMIRSRQLLACPKDCPPRIYSLMIECWHEQPSKRPTSREVHQKLRAWYLDNTYALSSTTGQSSSASTSTAPSHHSSLGMPGSQGQSEPKSLPNQLSSSQPDPAPEYYSTVYPFDRCQSNHRRPDSPTTCSLTSMDDGVSEAVSESDPSYAQFPVANRYASLNRKAISNMDYRQQAQPLVLHDRV